MLTQTKTQTQQSSTVPIVEETIVLTGHYMDLFDFTAECLATNKMHPKDAQYIEDEWLRLLADNSEPALELVVCNGMLTSYRVYPLNGEN